MAVYKVLQDIEGEDHIILWLTPRQSIYVVVVFVSGVLAFFMSRLNILLAVPWLVPIVFFGFLAAPLGKDQPNDVWAAAQLRFLIKNRKRLWDQSGMQELVHITVPKRTAKIYTDGLNQNEVRSRLGALSSTIDSRGWAIKNSNVNMSAVLQYAAPVEDRLVAESTLAMEVSISDITAADDILDQDNNQVAQRFDAEIKRQEQEHKDNLRKAMLKVPGPPAGYTATVPSPSKQATSPQDYYFLNQPDTSGLAAQAAVTPLATFSAQVVAPGSISHTTTSTDPAADPSAQALLEKIHHDQYVAHSVLSHGHERVIKTIEDQARDQQLADLAAAQQKQIDLEAEKENQRISDAELAKKMNEQASQNAILKQLSQSDLSVATLAAQAKRSIESVSADGEVTISLH